MEPTLGSLHNARQPYIFYNDLIAMHQVILSRAEVYAPCSQQTAFNDAAEIIAAESTEAGNLAAETRSDGEDGSPRYITSQMSIALHTIVKDHHFHWLSERALIQWE